ncbi:MAG: hypothetical protein ACRD2U_05640, partial [Terriglobales bacterium]
LAATGRFFRYALGEVGIVENRVGMASKGSGYPNVMRLGANVPQPRLASKERTRTWGTGLTQPNLTTAQKGTITITAGSTPGFYHFTVSGNDGVATQTEGGWIVVGRPAATLTKTGDNQTGGSLTLTATLVPGSSGGTKTGASIFFSTDAGSLSQRIVQTDSSGNASVTLTLAPGTGTAHVIAEGPYGLGHPMVTFTETSN